MNPIIFWVDQIEKKSNLFNQNFFALYNNFTGISYTAHRKDIN